MAVTSAMLKEQNGKSALGDALSGAVAGAVGVMALDQVANFMYSRENKEALERERKARAQVGGTEMGPASVATEKISRGLKLELTSKQSETVANVIHYGLGILPGALYGMALGRNEKMGADRGFLYGLALFAINDELLALKLGLVAGPKEYPWQAHARGLAAHVAMGVATYGVFKLFSRIR